MSSTPEHYRRSAKASFDELYDRPHPARYFSALRPLRYSIPGHAQPVIDQCVETLTALRAKQQVRMLDLCSGYGINGALVNYRLSMDQLYDLYDERNAKSTLSQRVARDRAFLRDRRRTDRDVFVIGHDIAVKALDYGNSVGFLNATIKANLERRPLRPREARLVSDVDLITVTGGLSYIGPASFEKILRAADSSPWLLFFPLLHTPMDEIRDTLGSFGLSVEEADEPVVQRRFKDERERQAIAAELARAQLGRPAGPYLEARVCLARPAEDIRSVPLDELLSGTRGAESAA